MIWVNFIVENIMQQKQITINNQILCVGEKYLVFSPLDSPFLFLDPTQKELRNKLEKEKNSRLYYTGTLIQVPSIQDTYIKGSCLFFEVDGVEYSGRKYVQAERLSAIYQKRVTITSIA